MAIPDNDTGKSSTGLEPNLAAALAYLFGFITGLILLSLEKDSAYVRFHAAQSTAVFVSALVLNFLLLGIPIIGWLLLPVLWIGGAVLWAFLMFKALAGQRFKVPFLGDFAARYLA